MSEDFDDLVQSIKKSRDYSPEFRGFVDAMNELISFDTCLLSGNSSTEDYDQYLRLVGHVESLWEAATILYLNEFYSHCLYFAVACLEEIGKIGVARFQLAIREANRQRGTFSNATRPVSRRGNPFFSHSKKHLLAAGAGALVNTRLDRILGMNQVRIFLDDIRSGKVEKLRQTALYADIVDSHAVLPSDVIGATQACFYVVLAGELMAEVLGFEVDQWERLLLKVQQFERKISHAWE